MRHYRRNIDRPAIDWSERKQGKVLSLEEKIKLLNRKGLADCEISSVLGIHISEVRGLLVKPVPKYATESAWRVAIEQRKKERAELKQKALELYVKLQSAPKVAEQLRSEEWEVSKSAVANWVGELTKEKIKKGKEKRNQRFLARKPRTQYSPELKERVRELFIKYEEDVPRVVKETGLYPQLVNHWVKDLRKSYLAEKEKKQATLRQKARELYAIHGSGPKVTDLMLSEGLEVSKSGIGRWIREQVKEKRESVTRESEGDMSKCCSVEGCANKIFLTGKRGRPRKYCDEH